MPPTTNWKKNKPLTLPPHLLKQLGVTGSQHAPIRRPGGRATEISSRKDRRKAERVQKREPRISGGGRGGRGSSGGGHGIAGAPSAAGRSRSMATKSGVGAASAAPDATRPADGDQKPKSILKRRRAPSPLVPETESDEGGDGGDWTGLEDSQEEHEEDSDEEGSDRWGGGDGLENMGEESDEASLGGGGEEEEAEEEEEEEEGDTRTRKNPAVSRTVKDRLARDDAEIAQLEKKLGLKGRKSLPQSFMEDGLGDLLGPTATAGDGESQDKRKRKAEADEWLASKRRKAVAQAQGRAGEDGLSENVDSHEEHDSDGDDFDGDEEEDDDDDDDDDRETQKPAKRVRENPYVAPVGPWQVAAKYVPPSLRGESASDAESSTRVRRQAQGLINRITDSNLVSILGDIEKLYRDNARQHVSLALVQLLLARICDPTSLPDTHVLLMAGFATAVYRVIGMDFGAQLIQEIVERFQTHYDSACALARERPDVSKETSNLITFVAEMYNFQMLGPTLIFDYIRLLLDNLTELNAELLLRIIRLAGPALRLDDPLALKDIVVLIRPAVAKIGEQNLSVRTKFMIDAINDLKNNKMRAGVKASTIVSEHTTRMRKLLGSLNTRKLKSTEPLRMSLRDIGESDKKGKWWLVGASWAGSEKQRGKSASEGTGGDNNNNDNNNGAALPSEDGDQDSDDEDKGVPDLADLAREQMMNTDVRRSIFVAVVSATDCQDAHRRVLKLRLNKDRQREIPTVIMQCAGAEAVYNPYYALVARRLCEDDRRLRWAFQSSLWSLFRRLGESVFGDEADEADGDDDDDEEEDGGGGPLGLRRLVNVAKLFGTLVADGALTLGGLLKCLSLPYLQPRTRAFVEVILITVLVECRAKGGSSKSKQQEDGDEAGDAAVTRVFLAAGETAGLARELQWFLRKVVRKSELAGEKGTTARRAVKGACEVAEAALERALVGEEGVGE